MEYNIRIVHQPSGRYVEFQADFDIDDVDEIADIVLDDIYVEVDNV
jgi:hypothetical protein